MMPTLAEHSRRLWSGVLALLLMVVVASGLPNSLTWADQPDATPTPAQPAPIESFSFQLERPPAGATIAAADAPVQPMAGGDWSELMSTGFEGTFLPTDWEVQGEEVWVQSGTQKNNGSYSAAVENFAGAPATWLVYGGTNGFSLDDATDARLNFAYWLDTGANAYFGWAASADGVSFYGARTFGRVGAWLSGSLDLKHLIGDDSVWIAFAISGDGSGTGQNVFVDDVVITTQEPYRSYLPVALKSYVPPSQDFHDDFGDPNSGWPVEHVDNPPTYEVHRGYSDGTYWMKLNYIWFHRIFASPEGVTASGDYTLQTDLMYDFGDYRAEWGVIFEASDDMESYYTVALYRYGESLLYRIRRRTPSEGEVDLVDAGAPWFLEHISWKWSIIRVVRQGSQIRFYGFNPHPDWLCWELIKSVTAPPLSGRRVGYTVFSSEQGSEAYFDHFHLWQEAINP